MTSSESAPNLETLLTEHRSTLARVVRHRGSGILRFESVEDLVQGVQLEALSVRERFEYRGDPEFIAWISQLARQHIANRWQYWSAKKRAAKHLVRVTLSDPDSVDGLRGFHPAAVGAGPATFAERRDLVVQATRALELLLERDRQLIEWSIAGITTEESAQRLGVSKDAAERARQRAFERLRKTWALLDQRA